MEKKASFNLSVNIKNVMDSTFNYILTPNAQKVFGGIVNGYLSGIHSFSIIGTYGTGKSSFLFSMERDFIEGSNLLVENKSIFANASNFDFINIVGDYAPLSTLLANEFEILPTDESKNIFDLLSLRLDKVQKKKGFLFLFIDEFGKILEHAANTNPEKELYFIQKLAEYVNAPSHNMIMITTLHQNFGAYSSKLSETQRNEWIKVKGRFKELVFVEPVEQLLYITTEKLMRRSLDVKTKERLIKLFQLAKGSKIVAGSLSLNTSIKLYPLDTISASCLTLALQRYGQNERTLFLFLNDNAKNSVMNFDDEKAALTYNLAMVYDYISYNLYSTLLETNIDSTNWRAIRVAIERIESGIIDDIYIDPSLKIVKTIGLLNIFFNGVIIEKSFLMTYADLALNITNSEEVIDKLTSSKVIRYATYKSQYILFEGTNINIEEELYKAARIVLPPRLVSSEVKPYIHERLVLASASYYKTGTPRYFNYIVSNEPIDIEPSGDIDGYINIIFPLYEVNDVKEAVANTSRASSKAILYAIFNDTNVVKNHLFEIKKLQYLLDYVVLEDKVAKDEVSKQIEFEIERLNDYISYTIENIKGGITWIFNGEVICLRNRREFNQFLSYICDNVYSSSPIIKNELFNRHKVSSTISSARINLFDFMINHWDEQDFGMDSSLYPPEKTIYYTLFKETGIHRKDLSGMWILGCPTSKNIQTLWNVSEEFLRKSSEKQLNLNELSKILTSRPYKLKQGVVDFWIPIFLFIKQQEYALYNDGKFVFELNSDVIGLFQKGLKSFSIKAFNVSNVSLEIFNKYREFLNKEKETSITSASLVDVMRPFFHFFNGLNEYAKTTRKFDNVATARFRDVMSKAVDPCKTFLEDIPKALGYNDFQDDEFMSQYLNVLKTSIHELVICYDLFIDRIEKVVIDHLGLPCEYSAYKQILTERYLSINKDVLTDKTKAFLNRVLSPSESKREFYEKVGYVVFDKKIEYVKDKDEALFLSNLVHLFSELEKHRKFEVVDEKSDELAFSFELATNKGDFKQSQLFRLPKSKLEEAKQIEKNIQSILSGNREFDVCILLDLLNERIK